MLFAGNSTGYKKVAGQLVVECYAKFIKLWFTYHNISVFFFFLEWSFLSSS